MPPDLQRAALEYAERGWGVFPLRPGAKVPACAHGCRDATRDPERIERWWCECREYGVGVATGSVSGICVIDLDGDPRELMAALMRRGPMPPTLRSRTGSGGLHLIYRLTGRLVPNSAKKLAPGVDTRGEGGYIVAPPSLHPSGRFYEFDNDDPIAAVPPWIVHALTERPVRRAAPVAATGAGTSGPLNFLRRTANGERNNVLNWAAFRLFVDAAAGKIDAEEAEALLHRAASDIGLTEQETQKTIRSARRAALDDR